MIVLILILSYIIPLVITHLDMYYIWVCDTDRSSNYTIGDMYNYYLENCLVLILLAWTPIVNFVVSIAILIVELAKVLFNLIKDIRIR